MDYFTELLESYSRLKKRRLVLLEAENEGKTEPPPQPEQSLDDVLSLVKKVAAPAPTSIAKRVNSKNKEVDVQVYQKQPEGHWVGLNATPKGRATIVDPKGNPTDAFQQWYDRNFGKGQTTPTDTVTDEDINRPGRQFETAGLFDENLNTNISEVLNTVTRMAEVARLLPDFKDQAWLNPSRLNNYVTGKANTSMEQKLANGTIATIDPEEGFEEGPLASEDNLDLMIGATFSMNQLLSFGTNDVNDDNKQNRCRQVKLQVSRKGDKYIFHSFGDLQEGVVMKKTELLDFAASRVEEICGEPIAQVKRGTLEGDFTEQELADYRGTGLEVTFAGAAFFPIIDSLDLSPQLDGEIKAKFGKFARKKLLTDQDKFVQAMKWARTLVKSGVATDLDSDYTADAILALGKMTDTPEGLVAFFSAAMAMEEVIIDKIKPAMSIPTGLTVGAGYKDDLKYVFFDQSSAEAAAKEFDLQGGPTNPVQKIKVSDLKKQAPEVVGMYQEAYGSKLNDDVEVFAVGCSVKSYHADDPTKAGEIKEYWRRSGLVRGTVVKDVAPRFEKVCQDRLGFTPTDLSEAREYQTDVLDNIYTTLDSILPTELTAMQTKKGLKQVDFETIRPIIEARVGKLEVDSKIATQFKALLGSDGQKVNLQDDAARRGLKENLNRLLINYKQSSDCNKRDGKGYLSDIAKKARKNLAYTTQLTGGALHDTAINKKILNENEVHAGSHQAPINTSTKGILDFASDDAAVKAGDMSGDWGVALNGSGSSMRLKKKNTNQSVTLGTKRKKRGAGKAYRGTNTTVFVSNDLAEESLTFNQKLDKRTPREDNENLMISFLQGQARLLEDLLTKKTN